MWALLVQSRQMAREDAPPFIPEAKLLEGLYGVRVFAPYPTQRDASNALRMFPSDTYNLKVVKVDTLSEALDNPYAFLWHGDAPDA